MFDLADISRANVGESCMTRLVILHTVLGKRTFRGQLGRKGEDEASWGRLVHSG